MNEIKRLLLTTILLVAAIGGGVWWVVQDRKEAMIRELETQNQELAEHLQQRSDMLDRLGRERRIGVVQVIEQQISNDEIVSTSFRLIELDDDGSELARQEFTVPGDVVFIDAQTAKFNAEDVGSGHPFRGRTLVLLRRVYSDQMAPQEGWPIDLPGAIPPGYASETIGRFEQGIWEQFWALAAQPKLAESIGIRVAQGEAVYKSMRTGENYELRVDAFGGINLMPMSPQVGHAGDLEDVVNVP